MFNSISAKDLIGLNDINIIDLRSVEKFNFSHIPGSINVPADKILLYPDDYIRKDLKYYVYCQHGITSKSVCNILSKLGYNLVNIDGGFESWLLSNS